jgi:predicted small metal-binding protein
MAKQVACGDVVPGCSWKASATDEEKLIAQVAEHAHHAHGVKEVTPELAAQVKAAIRER